MRLPLRSARPIRSWCLWRARRLVRSAEAAFDAGRYTHARALLDRADTLLRVLGAALDQVDEGNAHA